MDAVCERFAAVERELEKVDFQRLWPGFRPYPFALYTEERAVLKGRTVPNGGRFRGNTAIPWEGGYLAVWDMGRGDWPEPEVLAAGLVHEMFHAFQLDLGESRSPDDLAALDYPMEVENLSQKLAEDRLLARALRTEDRRACRAYLVSFRALREKRRRRLGERMDQELLPETLEGMAEYVGLCALRTLDPERYRLRLADCLERLETAGAHQLDIRRIAYDTGPALLLAAETAGLSLYHRPGTETRTLYELLRDRLEEAEAPEVPPDGALAELLERREEERKELLTAFLRRAGTPVSGNFVIQGYDPMNMWKQGDLLYGSHFWSLRGEAGEVVQLTGEAVLRSAGGRRVSAYWKGGGQ